MKRDESQLSLRPLSCQSNLWVDYVMVVLLPLYKCPDTVRMNPMGDVLPGRLSIRGLWTASEETRQGSG